MSPYRRQSKCCCYVLDATASYIWQCCLQTVISGSRVGFDLDLLPSVPHCVLFSQNGRCIVSEHNNPTTERKLLDAALRKPTHIDCSVNMGNKVASHRNKHKSVTQQIFLASVLPLFICSVLCPGCLFSTLLFFEYGHRRRLLAVPNSTHRVLCLEDRAVNPWPVIEQ